MTLTVRVCVERRVHDKAVRQPAAYGLAIGDTLRIVLEHAALVSNPTTVAATEAASC